MPIHHHYACTSSPVVVVMPANLLRGNVEKKGWRSREIDLKILSLSLSQHGKSQTPSLPLFFQSIDINLLSPPFIKQQKSPPKPQQKQPKENGGERKEREREEGSERRGFF